MQAAAKVAQIVAVLIRQEKKKSISDYLMKQGPRINDIVMRGPCFIGRQDLWSPVANNISWRMRQLLY